MNTIINKRCWLIDEVKHVVEVTMLIVVHYLHSCSLSLLQETVSLFQDGQLNTVALREGDSR